MWFAALLLGAFLGLTVGCLIVAARRGLWLKVEISEHVRQDHTVTVFHRHDDDALLVRPAPVPRPLPGRVQGRPVTSLPSGVVSRKEIGQ